MVQCPQCGSTTGAEQNYCGQCGAPLRLTAVQLSATHYNVFILVDQEDNLWMPVTASFATIADALVALNIATTRRALMTHRSLYVGRVVSRIEHSAAAGSVVVEVQTWHRVEFCEGEWVMAPHPENVPPVTLNLIIDHL